MVSFQALKGQGYGTTLGVRFANDNVKRSAGLSVQQRIAKRITLEGIVQTDFQRNTTGHALIKLHHPILTKRLNYYVGTGLSFGNEVSEEEDPATMQLVTTYGNTTFGGDVITGLELALLKYNISIDYKPNFNMVGRNPWYLGQVGISVRAVLVKASEQNRKKRQRQREKRREERQKKEIDKQPI